MTYQTDSQTIANYLAENPQFFEEHNELLAKIKLTSPLAGRTVSLQERQMEVLREKVKTMELRLAELLRIAQENDDISQKFQRWTRSYAHGLTHGTTSRLGRPASSAANCSAPSTPLVS